MKKSQVEQVYSVDGEIDQQEREIENICMRLLLLQRPFASDLRKISAALKMISDMERIGDPGLRYRGHGALYPFQRGKK